MDLKECLLKQTAFSIDSYYKEIINKSEKFLESSGGSVIPQGMDKIELYYTEPIFIKKDLVNICTSPIEQKYVGLEQIGHGSYATVYSYTDPFYNRKYVLKRAKNNLSGKNWNVLGKNTIKWLSFLHHI